MLGAFTGSQPPRHPLPATNQNSRLPEGKQACSINHAVQFTSSERLFSIPEREAALRTSKFPVGLSKRQRSQARHVHSFLHRNETLPTSPQGAALVKTPVSGWCVHIYSFLHRNETLPTSPQAAALVKTPVSAWCVRDRGRMRPVLLLPGAH